MGALIPNVYIVGLWPEGSNTQAPSRNYDDEMVDGGNMSPAAIRSVEPL